MPIVQVIISYYMCISSRYIIGTCIYIHIYVTLSHLRSKGHSKTIQYKHFLIDYKWRFTFYKLHKLRMASRAFSIYMEIDFEVSLTTQRKVATSIF